MAADRDGLPLPESLTERLIVGPERARFAVHRPARQARTSIRIIDAKLSDPDLAALLRRKRGAGVAVEIIKGKRLGDLNRTASFCWSTIGSPPSAAWRWPRSAWIFAARWRSLSTTNRSGRRNRPVSSIASRPGLATPRPAVKHAD